MLVNRAAVVAAGLLLSACGLDTFGLTGGTTAMSDGSTAPTDGLDTAGPTEGSAGATTMSDSSTAPKEPFPETSTLQLSFSQVKQFDFTWSAAGGADYYQLLERPTPGDDYQQLGGDIVGTSISLSMPLHLRFGASYRLRACNTGGCGADSPAVYVVDSLAAAVGYFKASNSEANDYFGLHLALSADGYTLIIGAQGEDSPGPIDGNQRDNTAYDAGAAYVFVRENNAWSQQAYLKASNAASGDYFGGSLAVSADGNTLAVSAFGDDSAASGINGNQNDNAAPDAGAVAVFVREDKVWSQQAYVKASNTAPNDYFGAMVALSADGNTLAVAATNEASGISDDQTDNSTPTAGAVYVFVRDEENGWSQQRYLKAPTPGEGDAFGGALSLSSDGDTLAVGAIGEGANAGTVYVFERMTGIWSEPTPIKPSTAEAGDRFGLSLALSGDGATLAVGAPSESSHATGIGGDEADNSAHESGAAYVFVRANTMWSQQAYVKASNSSTGDAFGNAVAVSADGNTLVVGAYYEDSASIAVAGEQADDNAQDAGAVYVFVRSSNEWAQRAYLKAASPGAGDLFGYNISVSADGTTLAVCAPSESSASVGIGGYQADNSAPNAGAVYLY